jgi:hypothetical protein
MEEQETITLALTSLEASALKLFLDMQCESLVSLLLTGEYPQMEEQFAYLGVALKNVHDNLEAMGV